MGKPSPNSLAAVGRGHPHNRGETPFRSSKGPEGKLELTRPRKEGSDFPEGETAQVREKLLFRDPHGVEQGWMEYDGAMTEGGRGAGAFITPVWLSP